jgi:multidrug resistance efflux pump
VELDEDLQLATESSLKTAIARAEKAEAELSDYKAALEIANSSSDELVCRWRELHAEVERLKIIEEKFRQSPMWDVLAIVQTRNNWQACAEKAEAEVERWQTVAAEMSQEREHNANEASRLRAEVEQLNLELEANKRKGGGCQCSDDEACAHVRRAEKAETELAAMKGTL